LFARGPSARGGLRQFLHGASPGSVWECTQVSALVRFQQRPSRGVTVSSYSLRTA
jgi:hypothetical protein